MQPIMLNNMSTQCSKPQPAFKGNYDRLPNLLNEPFRISEKNRKLISETGFEIEKIWKEFKKNSFFGDIPKLQVSPKGSLTGIVTPVKTRENELLLEIPDKKFTERIYLSREYLGDFRYEKTVSTDHGSATLKYHDSRVNNDSNIAKTVNEKVHTYLSELISAKIKARLLS